MSSPRQCAGCSPDHRLRAAEDAVIRGRLEERVYPTIATVSEKCCASARHSPPGNGLTRLPGARFLPSGRKGAPKIN